MKDTNSLIIHSHKKLIDRRLAYISSFLVSMNEQVPHFIQEIIFFLMKPNETFLSSLPEDEDLVSALVELKRLISKWNFIEEGDIIGYIYQSLKNRMHKKSIGQYFTPPDIIDSVIIQSLQYIQKSEINVLDPACGSGNFLAHLHTMSNASSSKKHTKSSEKRIHIYGCDIDQLAVDIAHYNMVQLTQNTTICHNIVQCDFLSCNSLPFNNCDNNQQFFDLIIGNPPWKSKFNKREKTIYKQAFLSAQSGINTFSMFIEQSMRHLRHGGLIAFLLPESLLNIKAHASIRKFILDNFLIRNITVYGDVFKGVFAPSIFIILQYENDIQKRKSHIIHINNRKENNPDENTLIPQSYYLSSPDYVFNIHYSRKAIMLLSQIENNECIYLKDRVLFFLGIVTGNNTKYLSKTQNSYYTEPIIIGQDLSQYSLHFSNNYLHYTEELQQVAPKQYYTTKNKILYKFIGRRLTFSLDTEGYFSLNNVNGIILNDSSMNIETVISLLNSWIVQYYYDKMFFTVKVLRGNLERLPLKIIKSSNQKKISDIFYRMIHDESSSMKKREYRETIEDIILSEYQISDQNAYQLNDYVKTFHGTGWDAKTI